MTEQELLEQIIIAESVNDTYKEGQRRMRDRVNATVDEINLLRKELQQLSEQRKILTRELETKEKDHVRLREEFVGYETKFYVHRCKLHDLRKKYETMVQRVESFENTVHLGSDPPEIHTERHQ